MFSVRADFSRLFLALILGASLAALAAAFAGQYLFGLEPCILCLWQRVPFAAGAVVAAVGLFVLTGRGQSRLLIGLAALIFALGSGLAFFHVGVQQHWWGSIAGCGGGPVSGLSIDDLTAPALAAPAKPCDVVDWRLFGLSLAGWNTIASAGLAAACLVALTCLRKTAHR